MTDKPLKRMRKARAALLLSAPFFGALAIRLQLEEHAETDIMAVDGKTLRYNSEKALALPFDQLKAVIAHEVMHCAAGHPFRRGNRNFARWNAACDYAINPIIRDAGFTLPPGALLDPAYDGKSAEAIYAMLGDRQEQGPDDNPCGTVDDAPAEESADNPGEAPTPTATGEQDWKIAALQAEAIAKRAGEGSQAVERALEEIKHPAAPWRDILRQFVTEQSNEDYTWRQPNRRFIGQGIYLPSLRSERLGEIVVAIDTSGSTSYVQTAFFEELSSIFADCEPSRLHLVYADSEVRRVETFDAGDDMERRTIAGGGTDFRPVFDWVDQQEFVPAALVYLTDLEGPTPAEAPAYPVLWASVGSQQAPFGQIVKIDA